MTKRNTFLVAAFILATVAAASPAAQSAPSENRIQITAHRFSYAPHEITVKKGEPVTLVVTSTDVNHGLRFRELNLELRIAKKKSSELTFTPNRTGDFVGHCSLFCGSGHGGMELTLHVVD